ncbi:MAG: hypothetical protein AAGH68_04270 [Pseudomonadota bacterium]
MKNTSLVLMGLSVSSGIGGALLLAANLLVWAVLTFWIGSMLAFAGFLLIVWALRPGRDETAEEDAEQVDTTEPVTT